MKIKSKKFDCIKSVRKEQDRIATDTEGMATSKYLNIFENEEEKRNFPTIHIELSSYKCMEKGHLMKKHTL